MEEEMLDNFVPYPRSILDDLREHRLTPNEYDLLMRLRHMADLYANTNISLEGLTADLRHRKWKKNYINQLLLHLKDKRYLVYRSRAGHRGSFKLHFPDFKLPNGKITKIAEETPNDDAINSRPHSEVSKSLPPLSKSLPDIKASSEALLRKMTVSPLRASYNDTDKEKIQIRQSYPLKREILVSAFEPNGYEDEKCREIALALRERTMNYLLGIRYKHSFALIERAWGIYRELDTSEIENPARYFNGIIKKLLRAKDNSP